MNNNLIKHIKRVLFGYFLVIPVLFIAVFSFWSTRELDASIYRLLAINTLNAFWLLWAYAAIKVTLGIGLGLIYIPIKVIKFDYLLEFLESKRASLLSETKKSILGIVLVGLFLGIGSLGLIDLATMTIVRFLYK